MTQSNRSVLIWGAGAIGGTIGAFLARAGLNVTLVDTSIDHVTAIQTDGLSIVGPIAEFNVRANIVTPDRLHGQWPIILLAVKAPYAEAAARALIDHLEPEGAVLSLQNGLLGDVMARIIGVERTYTALVDIAADMLAPGKIRLGFYHPMPIGPVDGNRGAMLDDVVATIRMFDPDAFAAPDIQAYIWGKNVFTAITTTTALALSPMADLIERADLEPLWRGVMGEMVAVAYAVGVTPKGVAPFDPAAFFPGASNEAGQAYFDHLARVSRAGKPHSGMWRDLAVHKRKTEIEGLITPVCELGARHGAPCPILSEMVRMVCEVERGERDQADQNLAYLLEHVH